MLYMQVYMAILGMCSSGKGRRATVIGCFVGVGTFALRVWFDISLLFMCILFVSRSITPS